MVSVAFPAYNEAENIGKAVKEFKSQKHVDEVVVADNNSTDGTGSIARKAGATVFIEKRQGYGSACQRALKETRGYYIILVEPDGTFSGSDCERLLEQADNYDFVLGTRTDKKFIRKGANMNPFLRFGNIFIAKLTQLLYGGPELTDVGCTMRLIKRDALRKIQDKFKVTGSSFSPEMIVVALKNDISIVEIPVSYRKRVGTSKITGEFKKAFKLGLVMIKLIITYRFKD